MRGGSDTAIPARHRPGEKPADARGLGDDHPFAATIQFKMFPKLGAPEKEDGYTIAKATHEETGEEIVLKGKYGPVNEGELVQVKRYVWRDDARFGPYVQVWAVSHDDPTTPAAIEHYLTNLPGVGDAIAKAIVSELGADCLKKIDADPSVLLTVKSSGQGIDPKLIDEITEAWAEMRSDRKSMLYLTSLGVGDATAKKIIKEYGGDTQKIVSEDPYRVTEVDGVGFKVADQLAKRMGIGLEDPRRIAAGVEYMLEAAESDGHICLTREELRKRAPFLLRRDGRSPDSSLVDDGIKRMVEENRLWIETDETDGIERIYTTEHWLIETRLYEALEERLKANPDQPPSFFKKPADSPVTDEQWEAVERGFTERLSILTGGPGCGKTFSLTTLIDELDRHGETYTLLAPTGKAAKRMEETTGREASTIHRKLGFDGLSAPRVMRGGIDEEGMIDSDVVVVDEASMLDMRLAERLFSHTPPDARIVLVGDPDQLPAVGAGSVLHDLIESGRVPTTRLTEIFRQAERSLLVVNANRIREGKEPYWTREEAEAALGHEVEADWAFLEVEKPGDAVAATLTMVDRVMDKIGCSQEEVMVTAPSKKGDAGVYVLNQALQSKYNPDGYQFRSGDQPLRVGDRVMNTQNRYGKKNDYGERDPDIMNGDQGVVLDYSEKNRTAWVSFDGVEVPFSGSDQLDALIPSYAATTHKLQGSESPAIISPLIGSGAGRLLSRNLIYTAWTRSKEACIAIGSKETLREALKRDGTKRNTTLDLRVERVTPRLKARWERALSAKSADNLLYG